MIIKLEFKQLINDMNKDTSLRVLILSGSGRAFSAGGDLAFLKERGNATFSSNVTTMVITIG